MQYPSLFPGDLDTFILHGSRDGIGLDIDFQESDELSSNELDLITDAILQIERALGAGIGVGAGLWDTDRDTGIQVEEGADDDTIRFDTNGVERMVIDASGNVTKPNNTTFLAFADGTQLNLVVGGRRTINFQTEIFDIGGNFANPTFTAPVTGKYLFCVLVSLSTVDSAATSILTFLVTSNREYRGTICLPDSWANDDTGVMSINVIADMDAADTAIVQVQINGGANQADVNINTRFSACLIT